eukprot:TRINITY_DN1465_c0_g1_i5.p1 TRINITY_DN1465_c0_g1~~TRINITY_DN1465_c0_g1_i5.p1  ORF type:complete len:379 (+),score=54.45 TRINITY_DN1465_c0_g1_i5:45-1181(+)
MPTQQDLEAKIDELENELATVESGSIRQQEIATELSWRGPLLTAKINAAATNSTQGAPDLSYQITQLAIAVHTMSEKLPSFIHTFTLTPSEASKKPIYASALLSSLGLPATPALKDDFSQEDDPFSQEHGMLPPLEFKWSNHPKEEESYPEVIKYLKKALPNRLAYDVGAGKNLYEGNLFNVPIFSLRKCRGQHAGVVHKCNLHGRTDIVLLHEHEAPLQSEDDHLHRYQVDVAIEIKVPGVLKSGAGAHNEAMMQLVGMNVDNSDCTPAVVLSDLKTLHFVFQLELVQRGNRDVYVITKQPCEDFASAIRLVTQPRAHISINFSRPNTPPLPEELELQVSPAGDESDEHDQDLDEELAQLGLENDEGDDADGELGIG